MEEIAVQPMVYATCSKNFHAQACEGMLDTPIFGLDTHRHQKEAEGRPEVPICHSPKPGCIG